MESARDSVNVNLRLDRLRAWQRVLDDAFRVPGTEIRFGWDPIIGLVPWAGDLMAAMLGSVIIFHAHRMRVPRIVQVRMLINIAIDVMIGILPVIGDLADVFWKSNARNLVLLEHYAGTERVARPGDWLFVTAVIGAVLMTALLPVLAVVWGSHSLGLW